MGQGVNQVQCHQDLEPPNLEIIWCTVQTKTGSPLVGAAYRPGSLPGSDCQLISYLSNNLDRVVQATNAQHIILLGDFNVHHKEWLRSKSPTDQAGVA